MVKHIIVWTLNEMSDAEKKRVKTEIKAGHKGYNRRAACLFKRRFDA